MKHKYPRLVILEILLILASVLIFRSAWMLLDKIDFLNTGGGIIVTGILGILFSFIILKKLQDS